MSRGVNYHGLRKLSELHLIKQTVIFMVRKHALYVKYET